MNAVHFLTTAARHDVASTMTLRQAAILVALADSWAGFSTSDLAQHLGLQKPSVTRAVQTLAKAGLVSNRRDTADLRFRQIRLTGAGLAMLAEMEAARA